MSEFVLLPHDQYPTAVNRDNIEWVRDVGNAVWIHFVSGDVHKMHKDDESFASVMDKLKLSYLLEN